MTTDLATLLKWIRLCLVVAATCTTIFPILYAFSPWYRSRLGRAFMLQAVAFALAMDLTTVFQFWRTRNYVLRFWVDAIILFFVALASLWLTWGLIQINYRRRWGRGDKVTGDFDGALEVSESDVSQIYRLSLDIPPADLENRNFIMLKIVKS